MDDQQRAQLALDTWQKCQTLLPPTIAAKLEPASGDPGPPGKKPDQLRIIRLRILPTRAHMLPAGFWNKTWCFYEIGVGSYGAGLCLGGVQFLQFSRSCGDCKWLDAVSTILKDLQPKRPGFLLEWEADRDAPRPQLYTRYNAKPHRYFPVALAAADLAWLIKQSLPRFEALEPVPASSD